MTDLVDTAFTYDELIAYTDGETRRWREWLDKHPDALDVPYAEGRMATVRGLITHIFVVDLRYAQRLHGLPVTTYEEVTATTLDEIWAIGQQARTLLHEYLAKATDADMREVLYFPTLTAGTLTATKRKIASNVFLHAMRHWAQVASTVRAAGFGDAWGHDMLLSPVEM